MFLPDGQRAIPDTTALLRRLVLFDTYILQTIRFKEFIPLTRSLGLDNVLLLLGSEALKLELDPTTFIQSGQTVNFPPAREKPPLPLLSFSFSRIRAAQYNDYLVKCLEDIRRQLRSTLSERDMLRLEGAILRALVITPEHSGHPALRALDVDLRGNSPILKAAISKVLWREARLDVRPADLILTVHALDDTDFKIESNLEALGLGNEAAHKILELSFLAVAGLNKRIEEMNSYTALSGAIDNDIPLFMTKFGALFTSMSAGSQEARLERVLIIKKLPPFGWHLPDRQFDIERFLAARSSKEVMQFRDWLRTIDTASDSQIEEQVNSIRSRLAPFIHSGTGKSIRILVSTGIGAMVDPARGPLVGLGLGLIDSFLLERIFPMSGPTLFLNRLYPSLFRRRRW